jgi:hypothetical protein
MHSAQELQRLGESQENIDPTVLAAQSARDQALKTQQTLASQSGDAQYKPSFGRRLWRGVRGGLEGLAIGGIPGAVFGAVQPGKMPGNQDYGAPNSTYEKAAAIDQADVDAKQKALDEAAGNFKTLQDARNAGAKTINDARAGYGNVGTQLTDAQKANTDALKAQNESPGAKAALTREEFSDRWGNLAAIEGRVGKLPAEQEAIYLSTGKLPDPRQPREPSAEEIEVGRAQTLFVKEHGRPPTYDEYLGIVRGLKGRGDSENPDEAGNVVAEAINEKTAYQQQYTRNDDGTYTKAGSFAGDPKNTISARSTRPTSTASEPRPTRSSTNWALIGTKPASWCRRLGLRPPQAGRLIVWSPPQRKASTSTDQTAKSIKRKRERRSRLSSERSGLAGIR